MSEDKRKKPCKTGDLLSLPRQGIFLVLEVKWDSYHDDWYVHLVSQQTGKKFQSLGYSIQVELDEGVGTLITQQVQEDAEE